MSITGEPDGPPLKVGVAIADITTGHVRDHRHAGRAARRRAHRPRPPRAGQPLRLAAGLAREPRLRLARRRRGAAPARQRPPRDRALRGLRDERRPRDRRHRHQRAVRALLHRGRAARAGRRRALRDATPLRVEHRLELVARLADAIRERPTADWLAVLEAANVPGGPVRTIPEAFAHAPYAVVEHAHPRLGTVRTVRSPIGLDGAYPTAAAAPPLLGQHTGRGAGRARLRRRRPRRAAGRAPAAWPESPGPRRVGLPGGPWGAKSGWLAPYLPVRRVPVVRRQTGLQIAPRRS